MAIVVSVGQEGRSLMLRVMSGAVVVLTVRRMGMVISPVPSITTSSRLILWRLYCEISTYHETELLSWWYQGCVRYRLSVNITSEEP